MTLQTLLCVNDAQLISGDDVKGDYCSRRLNESSDPKLAKH